MSIESRFTRADFRELCFSILEHASWSLAASEPGRQTGLELSTSLHGRRDGIRKCLELAGGGFEPVLRQIDALLSQLINGQLGTSPAEILAQQVLERTCNLAAILESGDLATPAPTGTSMFDLKAEGQSFVLKFFVELERSGLESMSDSEWAGLSAAQRFLAAVAQMCKTHRESKAGSRRFYPPFDTLALERGTQLVERGIFPPRAFAPIQTSGRRPVQTYLSFADPGPGHLEVTVRERDLLRGTIVHIEYIDRGRIAKKSVTEAYRIPSIRHVARIRLVVGDTTPCTVYIGRPTFESKRYENDVLKSAHTIAAACSAMFGLGIADCKVAMDGMTASEAIEFMRAVAGNAIRDRDTQRLSAAFNVNTALTDDRTVGQNPVSLTERFDIAKCAIDLTRLGRFDKVTWDGADDKPSLPLVPDQLSESKLLHLVHEAHGNGLETYISAGMDAENMRVVTAIGVGGVGIGTKLHFRAPGTNAIGRVNPDAVRTVLINRDHAASQPSGRAAARLAQLDWLFHELHQSDALIFLRARIQDLRTGLFQALATYWHAESEAARIAMHQGILERILEVEAEIASIEQNLPADAVPASWKPYAQTLGSEARTNQPETPGPFANDTNEPPLHPTFRKALSFLAAVKREGELRAQGAQQGIAPLVAPSRTEELRRLIDDGDLSGIQVWFLE